MQLSEYFHPMQDAVSRLDTNNMLLMANCPNRPTGIFRNGTPIKDRPQYGGDNGENRD